MGKISLVRIDERLVHGQVMTKWSKGMGTNAIYIVDDATAKDDFMKTIFQSTGKRAGLKVDVFSIDAIIEEWNKDQFGKFTVILLFKTVKDVYDASKKGLPIEQLNVGGIAKKGDARYIITSVGITDEDEAMLLEMQGAGTEVYFQTTPDTQKVMLKDAAKK